MTMLSDTPFMEFVGRGAKGAVATLIAILCLIFLFVSLAPIPRSVVAQGSVSPVRASRTVQHDAGGIVDALPVLDGQFVNKGDLLLRFDTNALEAESVALATEIVSLSAEREGLIDKDDGALGRRYSSALRTLAVTYDLETDLILESERVSDKEKARTEVIEQLEGEILLLEERLASRISERSAKTDQHAILKELIQRKELLVDQGYASKVELNRLWIDEAALRSSIERLNSEISQTRGAITKARSDALRIPKELNVERLTRLAELSRQIADRRKRMAHVQQALARAKVVSPVAGQVIGLSVNTIGGFVSPGQTIAMIVPDGEELIIDVRFNPRDIDIVSAGMSAKIVFSAFPQRKIPEIEAEIESISTDVLTEPSTGQSYYHAKLKLSDEIAATLTQADAPAVLPGMPVDVFIPVRRTSILGYVWAPLKNSLRSSFKA